MLHRITVDPKTVPFPSVEVIDDHTLATGQNHDIDSRGVFRMGDLIFQWEKIPEEERARRSSRADPIRCDEDEFNDPTELSFRVKLFTDECVMKMRLTTR